MTTLVGNIRELLRYRELIYVLTQRDFKLRYKQATMGVLWAIFMPAFLVAAGLIIRFIVSRNSGNSGLGSVAMATVVLKSVLWAFFSSGLKFSTNSLIGNNNLVAKMAFPKEVFPIAAVTVCLMDMLIATACALPFMLILRVPGSWALLWIPVIVLLLVMLTLGLGLLLASLNLFFRDIKYIVEVVLSVAVFFTPVVYDTAMLGRFETLALLNPVAPLLEAVRSAVVLGETPNLAWLGYSAAAAVITLLLGYRVFKSLEYQFAERV